MVNLLRAGWVLDFVFTPAEWQVQTQSGQRFFYSCGMLVKTTYISSMTPSNPSLTLPHRSARSDKGKFLSVRGLLRFVSLFSLMFVALPAQAANYVFSADTSSNLPAGCTYVSPGIYSCGIVTLGAGDTISIGGAKPATIIFTGALTTGPSNSINDGGDPADLTLVTIGVLNLGVDTIVNADVFASAAVNLAVGSLLNGNLETASPTTTANVTGIVTLGANSSVSGYILTERCPSSRSSGSFRRAMNRGADTPAARRDFEGSAKSISPQ